MTRARKALPAAASAPSAPAIEDRGEIAITLDGVEMVLRPTFEAITAFEASTGKGLMVLAEEAVARRLTLGEVVQIATESIRAWGRATQNRDASGAQSGRIAELILDSPEGFAGALQAVGSMLALAATGGYTAMGEVKAATKATG